jgi:bacillithiol system protein YtxJ
MSEFKEITSLNEVDEILDESCQRKILIFKHSTTCPISGHAWHEAQNFIRESSDKCLVVMIKVIESRPVSNLVAEKLGVVHQSPQAILIYNQQVLWKASHYDITQDNIEKALKGETSSFNLI